jgi:hypothetical protein
MEPTDGNRAIQTIASAPEAARHPGPGRGGRVFGAERLPTSFHTVISPNTNQPFQDLPAPTGLPPFHLSLDGVLSAEAIQRIHDAGRLVFHAVGDTGGVNTVTYQETVAAYMEQDFATSGDLSGNPSFYYHLGDVVYYAGEVQNYYAEFYEPYNLYNAPIFAIPGNHDGDVDPNYPAPSLDAFVRNFCAQSPVKRPESQDAVRLAMTQPNVYWTLESEMVTIVGLYSNCPEGGVLTQAQIDWFVAELRSAPTDRPLIVAVHHPIYSAYGPHPGSQPLKDVLEQACQASNRIPDLVLGGHVHNYQRFSAPLGNRTVPFVIAGAGGYNQKLHQLAAVFHNTPLPIQMNQGEGTLENFCDTNHGYLRLECTTKGIHGDYFAVPDTDPNQRPLPAVNRFDSFDVAMPGA